MLYTVCACVIVRVQQSVPFGLTSALSHTPLSNARFVPRQVVKLAETHEPVFDAARHLHQAGGTPIGDIPTLADYNKYLKNGATYTMLATFTKAETYQGRPASATWEGELVMPLD